MRTKRLRIILVLTLTLSAIITSEGKTSHIRIMADSIFNTEQLLTSIDSFYNQKLQSQLAEFKKSKKGNWTRYIPSVSFGYTLVTKDGNIKGAIRPSIGLTTATVFQALDERKQKKAIIEAIKMQNQIEASEQKRRVKKLISIYNSKVFERNHFVKLIEIDRKIFAIRSNDYEQGRIKIDRYLSEQKSMMQREFDLVQKEVELENMRTEVLEESKVL